MITDDVSFLELTIGQEEMEQLYHEAMDEPPATLNTEDNPRDGLQPSESEPTLPSLGPGGMEVTVTTSMEHDSNTEEIVDNKMVRVDKEVQPTDTLDDLITCRGCKAVGYVLESCPVDHGLTYTDCQSRCLNLKKNALDRDRTRVLLHHIQLPYPLSLMPMPHAN